MKLNTFVQEAIFEIALGIHAGKVKSKDLVAVSPGNMNGQSVIEKSYIDFDVSVVVKSARGGSSSGRGKVAASLQVAELAKVGLEVGGERTGSSSSESEETHRIAFRVPVYFNAHMRGDPNMASEAALIEEITARNKQS